MLDNPKTGFGYSSEFQSSGLPWVTSSIAPAAGSPVRFDFPRVTRFITISNRDTSTATLSFGFSSNGIRSTNNKYILNPGQTATFEIRVKSLWVQGESGTPNYSVLAGLTTVLSRDMPDLTGSLGWSGVG